MSSIKPIAIEQEVKRSYLDYAMSVIVSRAIPDVRDGLKPVHRRILYAMSESNCDWNRPYRKSARIVGEVMGKYHPHGDSAIYDALVRMAQPFAMSQMLVDGQGNFGSLDGDSPAAMRYTESRMQRIAQEAMLEDIDKETVDFQDNYDGSEREPVVLPVRFPNVLVNGAGGIAVGMATNIAPHNLGEVIDAACLLIDNPEVEDTDLLQCCPAPDFPTGGIILGRGGAYNAAMTGRGSVVIRARTEMEEMPNGRTAIIVNEIPYQVNKARLVEKIADLVREKRVEGIADMRDESDKDGVRIVIETKRDAVADVVLNQLFAYSQLQTSFGVNNLVLSGGRPQLLNLRQILQDFIAFREEVITRRTSFLLNKTRDRAHLLIGLAIAVANIDEVIKVIRAANDPQSAREELMSRDWDAADVIPLLALVDDYRNQVAGGRIRFTEEQARGILELRLQRLTAMERGKIDEELAVLGEDIARYLHILATPSIRMQMIRDEMQQVREQYAVPRRSEIQDGEFESDIEALIQREEMIVTVTSGGYIKRVPLESYRAQRRGGKGRSGMSMKDEDVIEELFTASTHTPVLFFSSKGRVFKRKVYTLPAGSPQTRGKALVNLFPLESGETINTFMPLPEDEAEWEHMHIMFATSMGTVRRNDLSDFRQINSNGKIAMKLEEGERLLAVRGCREGDNVLLSTRLGRAVQFPIDAVRVFKSRASTGVRALKLLEDDVIVSMAIIPAEAGELKVLSITEKGYGKRTAPEEYRLTNRGTQGVLDINTDERNGGVVLSLLVDEQDHIMLMTDKARIIRMPVAGIRVTGRNTKGVRLLHVDDDEQVVSAVRIAGELMEDDPEASADITPPLADSEDQE